MSQYSWPVKQIWFGVEGPEPNLPMLGIIKRSGRCKALGHFCHVKISVNGKNVWASGAEDRIFYMHLVTWNDIGMYVPKDMIPAIGWCKDGDGYSFLHEGKIVEPGREGTLHEVNPKLWQDEWKDNPLTLMQRGSWLCGRPHLGLLEQGTEKEGYQPRRPKPRVLLPLGCFDTKKNEFTGLFGDQEIWNGPPPSWCTQVVQIHAWGRGWIHLTEKEITTLWETVNGNDD